MKFNHTHEKTTVWTVENQIILVSNLPEELRNEIATWDRLQQEKLDAMYNLEKADMAAVVKAQQIHVLINQVIKKTQETQNNNGTEIQKELDKLPNESTAKKSTKK